ncbi:hypothetical protein SCOCK_20371 [Actinacidiphila cocklensis]|uniref:Uncharacterized protein n=1 Tax=Actinacidiphila cocklensis TaxID=887465 RepID=A0A9W4DNE0_9ACTN|nr:hypothetical protein SCOCK_20371 [Actinacidiphila cocklensis]
MTSLPRTSPRPVRSCPLRWARIFRCVTAERAVPRAPDGLPSAQRVTVFQGRGELRDKPRRRRRQATHRTGQHPKGREELRERPPRRGGSDAPARGTPPPKAERQRLSSGGTP